MNESTNGQYIIVEITEGAYRNSYLPAMTRDSDVPAGFYPENALGPANAREDGHGVMIRLHLAGVEARETDIDEKKRIFRIRDQSVKAFYENFGLKQGGYVVIEKIGERSYAIYPQRDHNDERKG